MNSNNSNNEHSIDTFERWFSLVLVNLAIFVAFVRLIYRNEDVNKKKPWKM